MPQGHRKPIDSTQLLKDSKRRITLLEKQRENSIINQIGVAFGVENKTTFRTHFKRWIEEFKDEFNLKTIERLNPKTGKYELMRKTRGQFMKLALEDGKKFPFQYAYLSKAQDIQNKEGVKASSHWQQEIYDKLVVHLCQSKLYSEVMKEDSFGWRMAKKGLNEKELEIVEWAMEWLERNCGLKFSEIQTFN